MTRIDRIFIVSISVILLSIPALHYLITSTEQMESTVEVLGREFVKNPRKGIVYPAHRFSSGGVEAVPVSPYWILRVEVDGETRSVKVSPGEKEILEAQYLTLRYQYLKNGEFRVITFHSADAPSGPS